MAVAATATKLNDTGGNYLRNLLSAYRQAEAELSRQLLSARNTEFGEWRLNDQLTQVRGIISALDAMATSESPKALKAAYEDGVDLAELALRKAGIGAVAENFGNALNTAAFQAMQQRMLADLMSGNSALKKQMEQAIRKTAQLLLDERTIQKQIASGILQGKTAKQVARDLERQLSSVMRDGVKVPVLCKDGKIRKYDPSYYSDLVARTMTRAAASQGTLDNTRAWGVDLVQFSDHANECEVCQPLEAKIFSISGKHPKYPKLTPSETPPIHPNCKHVIVPYVEIPE
jgi:hypothetical protein